MKRWPNFLLYGLVFILLFSSLPPPIARAEAPPPVTVSINAPAQVLLDSEFIATVDIAQVENLDASNYDVSFDPSVLSMKGVSGGEINGTQIPVSMLNTVEPGRFRVVQNLPGIDGVSGSGYLAQIRFHVIGAPSQTSEINLSNGVLGNTAAEAIPATWVGGSVRVTAHETALLSINAPAQVYENGNFTATLEVTNQVVNLDAGNYDVLFDPAVLEITNVTGGLIGETLIPVDTWNQIDPGRVAVVQNVPGISAATGSGTLAVLWFRVIGVEGQTSTIDLTNVQLGDNEAQPIPAQWSGDSVQVAVPVTPVLSTSPYPPSHDFGQVPRGEARQWSFDIANSGTGTLEWTISDDQPWMTLTPTSGTTTTGSESVTVSIDTAALQGGVTYTGTVTVSSNGGTATADITVSVLALPLDLTVTELTWTPAQFGDGDTATFTATVKNIGTGQIFDDFYVRFAVDDVTIGQRRVVGGLNAGASTQVTQTWQASPGTYTVAAFVDAQNTIAESDETNNILSQAMPEIPASDLTITALTWSSETINTGDVVTFVATVQNIGGGGTSREFHVFFEMDGTYIGQQKVFGLGAGASTQVSQYWTATKGSHTVKATADRFLTVAEANETNNALSQALPQVLASDLTVANLTWSPQQGITDGQGVTLTATVQNTGSSDILGSFFVRFDIDGTSVGRAQVAGGLAVGQSREITLSWTATVGQHTAKAVADDDNAIDETDETNNELSQPLPAIPASDLRVASIVSSPLENIYDGMAVTLTATVENTGAGGTLRSFVVRFEVDGVYLGNRTVTAGLAAGATTQVSYPWTAQVGSHTAKAIADRDNAVSESDESNNELSQALPEVLAPDLEITAITWSPQANISDGQQVTITATVENTGTGDTSRDFFVRFEVDGVYVGHQLVTGGLTAGQSKQVNQLWTAQVGTHLAKAVADETNTVAESTEDNNTLSQSLAQVPPADLVITSIVWSPATDINDGQPITLTATVNNIGTGATSRDFWVYFEVDDIPLGQQKVTGGLAVGESKQVSQTWAAQSGIHTAKAIADGGAHVTESDETNNQLPQVLTAVSSPDLSVVSIAWAPASFDDGHQVNLTATVKNTGTGATSRNFHVRFEVDGNVIGSQQVTGGLAVGETRQVSQAWTALVGTHTAKAFADAQNVVAESDETNNELSQTLPEVPASDLTVTSITWLPEANIADGQQVTITATVKNVGTGATSRNFSVRFEIDGNSIGSQQVIGGLAAGETRQVSQAWTAQVGGHTAKAIVDANNAVTESSESNNQGTESLPEVIAPDLVVTGLNWSSGSGAGIYEGTVVQFNATIQNTGAGDTHKEFYVRFEVDGNLIGRQPVRSGLAAGSSIEVIQSWAARPGPHMVRAIVDDSNVIAEADETNNQRSASMPVIPSADLTVAGISWLPQQIDDGDSVTLTATIQNNGASTLGSFYVRFELDGQHIGSQLVAGGLAGGGSQQVSQAWVATPGSHQVTAIADGTNSITESNEANNALSQGLPGIASPDLLITGVAFPGTIIAGAVVTFTATVTNSGASTSREFLVSFEIDGTRIGWQEVPGLGSSVQVSQTWLAQPGNHTLTVIADPGNQVVESNEENNRLAQNLPRVTAPDLVVTSVVAPEDALSGQQVQISWTVSNQGDADATGTWNDQVRLSSDQQPGDDQYLGTFTFSGTIPAGDSVVRSQAFTLPLIMSGDRWAVVTTDSSNSLLESNESNNATVDDLLFAVSLSPFPNLQVSSVTAPPAAFSQQATTVEWTVTNAGNGPTTSATWHDSVWLSLDQNLDSLDILLGSAPNASALNAGEGYVNSLGVTIPRGTEGDRYFIVKTDAFNYVFEFQGEDDNAGFGGPTNVAVPPQPDLQVTVVNAPASTFSGQTMTLSWRVTNKGGARTDAEAWLDVLFMSDNDVLDDGDRKLNEVIHRGALDPEQSYEVNAMVELPIGVSGTFYFFVVTDAGNNVFEHGFEVNNTGFDQVNINLTPPPDMEVEMVDAPDTARGSGPLTITYRVANNGATITPNYFWDDAFYLSSDTQLDGGDLFLGTRRHTGRLDAGASYTTPVTFILPVGLEGSFFAVVKTDRTGAVFEDGVINNNVGFDPGPIAVSASPPDLVMDMVDAPVSALAGHPLTISYRVRNEGVQATPNSFWTDAFYLSTDTRLDSGDLLLGTRWHHDALAVGGSYTESATFTLPNGLSGSYYAIAVTDHYSEVFEGGVENNNAGFDAGPIAVSSRPADLVVSAARAPAAAEAGTAILAEWTVTNQGTGSTVVNQWNDTVFASADAVLGNDTLLGIFNHSGLLQSGESYSRIETLTVPFEFVGQYYLFIVTDTNQRVFEANNEGNNSSLALPVTVQRLTADLQVTQVTAPATVLSGGSVTVGWTVQNLGARVTNASYWHDDVYLSTDNVIDLSDIRLGAVQHSGSLEPSAMYSTSYSFGLPLDLTGNFYLIVRTDSWNGVIEGTLENNNDRASASTTEITLNPVPDLVLERIDGPTAGVGGQAVTITWTVANRGENDAAGSWYDAVYLSPDQVFDPGADTYLGYYDHSGGLAVGGTYTETQAFAIPNGISGLFYILGVADSSNRIYERGSEANNVAVTALATLVTAAPPADLVMGTITVPATGVPGQNATITYTVTNQGLNPALGNWFDSIYLSADDRWDLLDKLFGRVHHFGDVAGGSSYTETLTARLGGLAPGDYYVIIRTDILNQVVEKDEQNNIKASLDRVDIDVAELVLDTSAAGFIGSGNMVYYRVEVPAGETLLVTLDSEGVAGSAGEQGSMELYVRYGDLPTQNRYDFAFSQPFAPDQEVMVNPTRKGTYYIMVYNVSAVSVPKPPSGGLVFVSFVSIGITSSYPRSQSQAMAQGEIKQAGVNYTLSARKLGFSLLKASPDYGSNRGQVTVVLTGSKLTYQTTASLLAADGAARPASQLWWKDSTELWATFDLRGLAPGDFDIRLEKDGEMALLQDVFKVTSGPVGKVEVGLSSPAAVRSFQQGVVVVDYMNVGETDIPAPVLVIGAENAELRLPGQKDFSGSLQLLALNTEGPAGILTPGSRGQFSLIFKATIRGGDINFSVRLVSSGEKYVEWDEMKDDLRPVHIPPEAWEAIWQNFKSSVGDTLGSYQAVLAENATRLSQLGYRTFDVSQLMAFEMMEASNELPFAVLDAQVDATAFVSSPPLKFTRVYLQPLSSRNRLGALGRGWVHSWEVSLSQDAIGNVLVQDMGTAMVFNRQPDGSYAAENGDNAQLTLSDGNYFLRQPTAAVWVFHQNGLLNYVEDPNGNRITLQYTGTRPTRIVHSNGESFTLSYNAQGRLSQLVDHAGRIITYAYDASGEHLLSVAGPAGTWSYTYGAGSLPALKHALLSITAPNNTHHYFEYDGQGRLAKWYKDGGAELLTYGYDSAGGVEVADVEGSKIIYLYDQFGQVSQIHDSLGSSTRFVRDARGNLVQLVQPGDFVYSYSYDKLDQVLSYVDPLGNRAEFSYDPALNVLSTMRDPRGNVTAYGYDERGNLLTITYADGSAQQYTYDSLGNATVSINGRGQHIRYTYDYRGLLTRKDLPDGSSVVFTYDSHGNMLSATDSTGVTSMTYDSADRLARITYPSGRHLDYVYDAAGLLTQVADQDGFTVHYIYDAVGRLVRLTDSDSQPIVSYTYDSVGNIVREDNANGTYTIYDYNAVEQISSIVNHAPGDAVNSRFDYAYDGLGRLVSMSTLEGEWSYAYDAIGQLVSLALPGGRTIEYSYDAAGNRTSATDSGVATAYTTNNLNQYTHAGTTTFNYDADGNLVSRIDGSNTSTYAYDFENRLVEETGPQGTLAYNYDFLGQIAATIHNGNRTEYLVDPGTLPFVRAQYDGSGNLLARYTYGVGLVSQGNPQGGAFYYDFDGTGSTVGLTGPDGSYANSYKYLPFGEVVASVEQAANPFTYAGQFGVMKGGSPDLFLMTSRWYSSSLGRFVSPDPVDLLGGDFNFYSYVGNRPVDGADPDGLWKWHWGGPSKRKAKYVLELLRRTGQEGLARFQWKTVKATWHLGFHKQHGWHLARLLKSSPIERHWFLGETVDFHMKDKVVTKIPWFKGARFLGKALGVVGWAYTAWEAGWAVGTFLREYVIPQSWQDALGNALYKVVGPIWDWWDGLWSRRTSVVAPKDPNDIVGPPGFGDEHWVTATETLPYTIRFENRATATAPAQVVTINHPLDTDLDWRSFRVGGFGWGDLFFEVPENRAFYDARLDLRESHGFFVDMVAGINIASGEAFWAITAIDPETGEVPEDPLVGFLPPNSGEGIGEGFVTYTIRPRADAATGAVIDAQARIVFNTEEPLDTPPIFNTIDAGAPASNVEPLPSRAQDSSFLVKWSGSDEEGGSGLAGFTVYVSDNVGDFAPWLENTLLTEASYTGQEGHSYAFYSVVGDNAGNMEKAAAAADAQTMVPGTSRIEGQKFNDLDQDGVRDQGEPGLAGWTIYLDMNDNGQLDASETSTTTDASGHYAFTELGSGGYRVAEVLQAGWTQTYPQPAPPGTHSVTLATGDIVTDIDFGNFQLARVADFTASPTSGAAPLTVQFSDLSAGTPVGWSWDFGDGTTSTEQNPSHVYNNGGDYTVSLTATWADPAGSHTRTASSYIHVIRANFQASPLGGLVPITVQFSDLSTGPSGSIDSWLWDFGDGSTSTEQNPSHSYTSAGSYTVSLTVADSTYGIEDTETRQGYINLVAMVAETNMGQEAGSDKVALIPVNVVRAKDPSTGQTMDIAGGIRSYQARVEFDAEGIQILDVRGADPFASPTEDLSLSGEAVFSASHAEATGPSAGTVAYLVPRLVGSATASYNLTLTFQDIADAGGRSISQESPVVKTYRRGDAKADGAVTITDALFIAQYLALLRPLSEINAINAASVRWDDGSDKISITDALFIAQYKAQLRDDKYNLKP